MPSIVITFDPGAEGRRLAEARLGDVADVVFLDALAGADRARALDAATVVFARNTAKELTDDEYAHLGHLDLIQFVTAGIDYVPTERLPRAVPVAVNGGGYAEPMAEHALAMTLAACKHLVPEHANLARGEFNQFTPTRMLRGMTAGILGFGGIGVATARVLRPLGVRVHAVNRRGASDEPVDWIAGLDRLDELLAASDVLVLSLPLTTRSAGMIGARELGLMKRDAILVNLARGEIVDEVALYRHLEANPEFIACIDAWWIEPVRHDVFRMDQPFMGLPNVIGSPHNSASVGGWREVALERALANCRRALVGQPPLHVVSNEERDYVHRGRTNLSP
ncbi:MAG: hydroxyacid dehydrogenase [Ectothiorhodospiraceae bacterium]|nr:hydroxyacid dehydrogenase [Ectothiorhodospiraceae bacterium]